MPKLIFRLFFSFLIFVSVFILIQRFLTPNSFGKYGHYRANAIEDNKIKTLYYKGEEACISCHQEVYNLMSEDVHYNIGCESCHVPKVDIYTECANNPPVIDGTLELCAQCHEPNLGGFKKIPQLVFEDHEDGRNCIECHNVHAPWELKE